MFKRISYQGIMVIEIIKSILIGVIMSVIIGGTSFDTIGISFFAFLYLLPAIFLYYFGYAMKLKHYICDMLYFIGFASTELYWIHVVISSGSGSNDIDDVRGISSFIIFTLTVAGIAIYLAEVIFRNQKQLKELGCKDPSIGINLRSIFWQIFKQPKSILIGTIRAYLVAVIVICMVSSESSFVNFRIKELIFIFYGLLFSLCLLPAIILYHSGRSLQLKRLICDIVYLSSFIIAELILLLFVWREHINVEEFSFLYEKPSELPAFGMSVIALGAIFVYMFEVYFRNRAIIKSLEQKNISSDENAK